MTNNQWTSITSVGGLLPQDLLSRISSGDKELEGLRPEDYHLSGARPADVIPQAWNRLRGAWTAFTAEREKLSGAGGAQTGLTREKWLLPLFDALSFGRLSLAESVTIDDDKYPVSHRWENVPIHLVGAGLDLDKRQKGERGAAAMSPHSLMQVLLNRDPNSLWGIVSNGLRLRVLRDSASLTRQAYIEFDLEAMFAGELYADFALLWLIVHQSRFEAKAGEACWLERWLQSAKSTGIRALDDLRHGVEEAIKALGQGFLSDPENRPLRDALKGGALTPHGYYQQLLRLVYRLIFVMVAEARGLLLDPATPPEAHDRYRRYYALERLRDLARRPTSGPRHGDLYEQVRLVMGLLAGRGKGHGDARALGLSVLNGFLFSETTTPHLDAARLANGAFLEALRALCYTTEKDGRVRPVDFRALGAEELGSVYESLLELVSEVDSSGAAFNLINAQGNDRKTTGSYYTPTSLITLLLDSALEPVVERALKADDSEKALLSLRVIDPACGSGHFLVAAAQRLARHLARVRTGEPEPAPAVLQHALRDVVRSCIYGVDVNPMSVELAKVSLWLEALEPGKPLSFLDHHLRVGNSLIGLGPNQTVTEIPDEAFTAVTGDDKKQAAELRKFNKKVRSGQMMLALGVTDSDSQTHAQALATQRQALEAMPEDTPEQITAKAAAFADSEQSGAHDRLMAEADLWTAAFFWPIDSDTDPSIAPTHATLTDLRGGSPSLFTTSCVKAASEICQRVGAFHWPLAFPEAAAAGGFDVVLGNPPWERIKIQEQEFFSTKEEAVTLATNRAERHELINSLFAANASIAAEFRRVRHVALAQLKFARESLRYRYSGVGDVNTYALFAETFAQMLVPNGKAGFVVPSGLATDHTTRGLFNNLVESRRLESLFEFENEGFFVGAGQGHMVRFALTTVGGEKQTTEAPRFLFQGKRLEELRSEFRVFEMSANDISRINPGTGTCPVFQTRKDAELNASVYSRVPVLRSNLFPANGESGQWHVRLISMFHMANDSELFRQRDELRSDGFSAEGNVFSKSGQEFVPLYEAKMIGSYNHRHGDFSKAMKGKRPHVLPASSGTELSDASFVSMPFYWVPRDRVDVLLNDRNWRRPWLMGWRDVTDARASARTLVASVLPRAGAGHTLSLLLLGEQHSVSEALLLLACLNSLVLDYLARQKVGGLHLSFGILEQLPILAPSAYGSRECDFVIPRALELVFSANDLIGFAKDALDTVGSHRWIRWFGSQSISSDLVPVPFVWDVNRRAVLRAELDAYYAKLYGLTRDELRYILDPQDVYGPDFPGETFRVLKEREMREYGEYRTRRLVLEAWDRLVG